MSDGKWGILYCPKKSMFHTQKRWEKIEKCLHENQIDFDYVQSESTGSVERLVKMLINNGYKTIVIVGGDSALNDAVNCLMQVEASVRSEIALGMGGAPVWTIRARVLQGTRPIPPRGDLAPCRQTRRTQAQTAST